MTNKYKKYTHKKKKTQLRKMLVISYVHYTLTFEMTNNTLSMYSGGRVKTNIENKRK